MLPPMSTRIVGTSRAEPAVLAPAAPAMTRPTKVKPTIASAMVLVLSVPEFATKAPMKGMNPPSEKATAEATAACTGRALL